MENDFGLSKKSSDYLLEKVVEDAQAEIDLIVSRLASKVKLGIVTALPKEHKAILKLTELSGRKKTPEPHSALGPSAYYYPIELEDDSGNTVEVITCQTVEMGNNAAAISATCILKDYPNVENIFMVGIAGGIPATAEEIDNLEDNGILDSHIRLGDAIISTDGIFQYDMLKQHMGGHVEYRAKEKDASPILRHICELSAEDAVTFDQRVNSIIAQAVDQQMLQIPKLESDILQEFKLSGKKAKVLRDLEHPKHSRRIENCLVVHRGKIGSANILLKDPIVRDDLRKKHGILAIEMEGSGVADATWTLKKQYIAIRGICDYCDPNKNDDWQEYAAFSAAATLLAVIQENMAHFT